MKLTHHLDWSHSQPFITKTLLISFLLALSFHALFLLLFNIRDLLPKKERIHPFVKVEAKIPEGSIAIQRSNRYAKLLPKHPSRQLFDSIPEVRRPSFFPKAERLIAADVPKGILDVEKPEPLAVLRTTKEADKLIKLKKGAEISLEGESYRTARVLIDTRGGKLIALSKNDIPFIEELEKQIEIERSDEAPFEEEVILTLYD